MMYKSKNLWKGEKSKMNYLSASIMMLFIAAIIYAGTLIATSIYTITYPEAFETVLLLIGKFPMSLSI